MPARIGPKKPRRLFLKEWRDYFGLTQKQLGERLGVSEMTISRWEREQHKLNTGVMAAVAEAFGHNVEPGDLYRDPHKPSPDRLLRDASPEIVQDVISYIEYLKSRAAS